LILTTNDPDGAGPCVVDKDTLFIFFGNPVVTQTVSGTTGVCRPVNGVVYSVPSQAGVSYVWTVPANVVIASGQGTNSISANWPSNGQAGNVCVTISSVCDSKTACVNVKLRTTVPGSIPSIIGETSACKNETFPYSIAGIGSADFYEWTPPAGAKVNGSSTPITTTSLSVSISFNATYAGDSIKVRGGNCVGFGPYKSMFIALRTTPPATPGTISGVKNGVCGSSQVYSIKPVAGATSYRWKCLVAGVLLNGMPSPVIIPDTFVTVTFPVMASSATIFVAAKNTCGTGTEKSLTVKTKPATPSLIHGPLTTCAVSSQNYEIDPLFGATNYTWTFGNPTNAVVQSGQGTESVIVKFNAAGTEKVKVRGENACGVGSYKTITVIVSNCPRFGEMTEFNSLGMEAYPNPTKELINISFNAPKDENYRMVLVDLMGRVVKEENFAAQEGFNQMIWDMSTYQSGMYVLTVQSAHGKSQVRIIVE
jgi:hypothetical protein